MKCTECPKYNECVITSDLRRKRRNCTYARDKKPITNYERIKNMSIEEMVEFLGKKPYCALENPCEVDCIYGWHGCQCEEHAKEWLESEVKE